MLQKKREIFLLELYFNEIKLFKIKKKLPKLYVYFASNK